VSGSAAFEKFLFSYQMLK